jgi:DNA-binding MarR family transcriptional regulator
MYASFMPNPGGTITAHPNFPPTQGLDGDLGWHLGTIFRSYLKAVEAVVSDLPGGPRGYQVLASAAQDPVGNQGSLAQQLGIDRTVLTYLVDDLEQVGLVERRQDPGDRRSRLVVATDQGRSLLLERQQAMRQVEQHILGPLGDDAPTFRALLHRLAPRASELDPIVSTCEIVQQLTPVNNADLLSSRARRRR